MKDLSHAKYIIAHLYIPHVHHPTELEGESHLALALSPLQAPNTYFSKDKNYV